MTHIDVQIQALADLASRLRSLQHEFEGMGDVVRDYHDAVGDNQVADRLGEFATNWSDKRKQVSELLGHVAAYAAGAAEAYAKLESEISSGVKGSGGTGGS